MSPQRKQIRNFKIMSQEFFNDGKYMGMASRYSTEDKSQMYLGFQTLWKDRVGPVGHCIALNYWEHIR